MQKEYLFQSEFLENTRDLLGWFTYPNIVHANIHQRFPAWFHYVLGTVQLHNLHHAQDRKYQDSNYSGSVPLWDILFRTYSHPDRSYLGAMGLENSPTPESFIKQVVYPFVRLFDPKKNHMPAV